jgi:hypothetical protein
LSEPWGFSMPKLGDAKHPAGNLQLDKAAVHPTSATSDMLDYMSDMLSEMRQIAQGQGHDTLSTLLALAQAEASNLIVAARGQGSRS